MDRECLEKIRQMTKDKITVSNFQNGKFMKENKRFNIKRIAIAVCLCMILTASILFQNDVKAFVKYCFGDKEIDIAAKNGYVEETNMNFIDTENILTSNNTEIVNDVNVSVKIDEFVMDDINLSTNFSFKFDDKIKEFLDLDNVQFVTLPDLTIFDCENRLITSNCSKDEFEERCNKYNLDYNWDDYLSKANTTSSSGLIDRIKEENLVKYSFNFKTVKECFPKSKELNFVFKQIKLEKYNNSEEDLEKFKEGEYLKSKFVILTGEWEINVKVPEKMYNRVSNLYKVVSLTNPEFDVTYALSTETGFKFNVTLPPNSVKSIDAENDIPYWKVFQDLENAKNSGEITEQEYNVKVNEITSSEEYRASMKKFGKSQETIRTDYMYFEDDEEKTIDKITHVTNSKGKKFKISDSGASVSLVDLNKTEQDYSKYEFIGTFELTNKDATDELTVTLIFYGEPVEIKLEKVK